MAEEPDEPEEDVSSLLAPRFRRAARPVPASEPTPATAAAQTPPVPVTPVPPASTTPTPTPPATEATPPAELPEVATPSRSSAPPVLTAEAATAIVGNERFLPVAEAIIVAGKEPGPIRIFVPVGTAVHVIEEGRVAEIDEHIGGEVTVRAAGDRFYHYRRLLPSSVCVESGERVAPGAIIGTVGDAIDDDPPCLVVGLQSGDGSWADISAELVGLCDPGELGLCVADAASEWIDPLAADRAAAATS